MSSKRGKNDAADAAAIYETVICWLPRGVRIVEVLCHTRPECQVNQGTVGEVLVQNPTLAWWPEVIYSMGT